MKSKKSNSQEFYKYVRDFLTIYLPKNRCLSKHTIKSYKDTINLFRTFMASDRGVPFLKINFEHFTPEVIYGFMNWLRDTRGCGVTTTNQRLSSIKSFLHYCANEHPEMASTYLSVKNIKKRKNDKGNFIKYLTKDELYALFNAPDTQSKLGIRDRFLMILMYDTAGRMQEILDLRINNFALDLETPLLYIIKGKGDKSRTVPLSDKTLAHMKEYMKFYHPTTGKNDALLFYSIIHEEKCPLSPDAVSALIKRHANTARKQCPSIPTKINAHMLRHSKAMHLYQAGVPLSYIKDILGHAHATTTSIYASADTSMIADAMEKAAQKNNVVPETPVWCDNEDMILELCGLL